jgi:hypothetical protein
LKKQLSLEKYHVVGIDLRNDEPFEKDEVVETKTSVLLHYQQRGYRITDCVYLGGCDGTVPLERIFDEFVQSRIAVPEPQVAPQPFQEPEKPQMTVKHDFEEIINSIDAGMKPKLEAETDSAESGQPEMTLTDLVVKEAELDEDMKEAEPPAPDPKPEPEPPKKAPPKKGTAGRLYEYIRQHPEPGVIKSIADATNGKLTEDNVRDMVNGKATCGRWFTAAGNALDILEADASAAKQSEQGKTKKGVLPNFWGTSPNPEGMGVVEESKLRRKTQKALIFWCQKHGADDLKPITRATIGKVNEATLRVMLTDDSAFEVKHWAAVDKALKSLALKELEKEGA